MNPRAAGPRASAYISRQVTTALVTQILVLCLKCTYSQAKGCRHNALYNPIHTHKAKHPSLCYDHYLCKSLIHQCMYIHMYKVFYYITCTYVIKDMYVYIRDVIILQYIDILQYSFLQYNTIHLIKISIYCLLQYIVIYCNISQHVLPSKL